MLLLEEPQLCGTVWHAAAPHGCKQISCPPDPPPVLLGISQAAFPQSCIPRDGSSWLPVRGEVAILLSAPAPKSLLETGPYRTGFTPGQCYAGV